MPSHVQPGPRTWWYPMYSAEENVRISRQVISQYGRYPYRNGRTEMNTSKITMSRPWLTGEGSLAQVAVTAAKQVVGLAEDLAGRGDPGQLASQGVVRQAADHVAGVEAEHRRAAAVGEVRGDRERGERPGRGGLAGAQVEPLGPADVHVVVQVALAAGPPGDRDHLGHAVGVLDQRHAERLAGRLGQRRGQHLAAHRDSPQPEIARA
jgi:hypothetical protein